MPLCEECGIAFVPHHPTNTGKTQQRFCNKSCRVYSHSPAHKNTCKACGTEFITARNHMGRQNCCSTACSDRLRHIRAKKWWDTQPEKLRRRRVYADNLRDLYGWTLGEYDYQVKQQKGRCLICRKKCVLVVDHCHKRNYIRGLLCGPCNSGLGMLQDSVPNLARAITYLARKPIARVKPGNPVKANRKRLWWKEKAGNE